MSGAKEDIVPVQAEGKSVDPFSRPSPKSDVVLVVEDKKLYVSKLVLSLASPVFEAMFEGDYAEKSMNEIPLPGKSYDDFVEFLLCIYPSTQQQVSRGNLDVVLLLADEYQVQALRERCEMYVLNLFDSKSKDSSFPSKNELVHYCYLADRYGLKKMLDACMNLIPEREIAVTAAEFRMISLEAQVEILLKRLTAVEKSVVNTLCRSSRCRLCTECKDAKEKMKTCLPNSIL